MTSGESDFSRLYAEGDTRDGFLSVARTTLFFLDLLALQRLLGDRRLITPQVEANLTGWAAEYETQLGQLPGDVRNIMEDPARVEAKRDMVEKMLAEFVELLPEVEHEHGNGPNAA